MGLSWWKSTTGWKIACTIQSNKKWVPGWFFWGGVLIQNLGSVGKVSLRVKKITCEFKFLHDGVRGGAKHRWKTDETDENTSIDKNFLVDWQIEDSAEYV